MADFVCESYSKMGFDRSNANFNADMSGVKLSEGKPMKLQAVLKKHHPVLQNLFNLNASVSKVLVVGHDQVNNFKPFVQLRGVNSEGIIVGINAWKQLMREIKIADACLSEDVTPSDVTVAEYTLTTHIHKANKLICVKDAHSVYARVCLGSTTVKHLIRIEDAVNSVVNQLHSDYANIYESYFEFLTDLKQRFEAIRPSLNPLNDTEVAEFVAETVGDYDIDRDNNLCFDNLRLFHELDIQLVIKHLTEIL